jgi:glyoxylase-like metal-dependent hydrolase (beta-lactamase superfamily II)
VRRTVRCILPKQVKFRDTALLKVRFVDVGQGDACIVETPAGRLLLIDGGEESHLHRYMSASFGHLLANGPIDCHAIVVTHGDADHFAGLIDVVNAKIYHDSTKPFLTADAVYHNGLVKKTSTSSAVPPVWESRSTRWISSMTCAIRRIPSSARPSSSGRRR